MIFEQIVAKCATSIGDAALNMLAGQVSPADSHAAACSPYAVARVTDFAVSSSVNCQGECASEHLLYDCRAHAIACPLSGVRTLPLVSAGFLAHTLSVLAVLTRCLLSDSPAAVYMPVAGAIVQMTAVLEYDTLWPGGLVPPGVLSAFEGCANRIAAAVQRQPTLLPGLASAGHLKDLALLLAHADPEDLSPGALQGLLAAATAIVASVDTQAASVPAGSPTAQPQHWDAAALVIGRLSMALKNHDLGDAVAASIGMQEDANMMFGVTTPMLSASVRAL